MVSGKQGSMIPIISIVGKTNSGKTTLVERIIPELKKKGYRVGTIKHDVHKFDIDHEGKDTYRMTSAGADTVVIASKEKMAMIKKLEDEQDLDRIANSLMSDMDIVITEGFKKQNKPKIEVTQTDELLCKKEDNLIAVVDNRNFSNKEKKADLAKTAKGSGFRYFKMDEIKAIIEFIKEKFLKNSEKGGVIQK